MIESEERQGGDAEVTLGMASLLGIFFGLVVLCGVLFGFGYSMGRRSPALHSASLPGSTAGVSVSASTGGDNEPSAKPTANGPSRRSPDSSALPSPSSSSPVSTMESAKGSVAAAGTVHPDKAGGPGTPSNEPISSSGGAPSGRASISGGQSAPASEAASGFQVQIAAVSRPQDAQALITALRKLSYSVSAHNEPRDKLLHVEIGPFATRAEANAMRQKLLADGYNAIVAREATTP